MQNDTKAKPNIPAFQHSSIPLFQLRSEAELSSIFIYLVGRISPIYSNFEAISRNVTEYKNKALKNLMILKDNKAFKSIHAKLLGKLVYI